MAMNICSILFCGLVIASPMAKACVCPSVEVEKAIARAATVEIGFVQSAEVIGENIIVSLSDVDVVKGEVRTQVSTPLQSSLCGMSIVVGREYWLIIDANSVVRSCNGSVQVGTNESILMTRKYFDLIRTRQVRGIRK